MKTRYLFPHRYKILGWILLVPALIVGALAILSDCAIFELDTTVFALYDGRIFEKAKAFRLIGNNIFDELVAITAIVGGLLAAFSREKDEDEYILTNKAGVAAVGYLHQLWLPALLGAFYLWNSVLPGIAA
ncbi:MAG TPA: hypothetical protein VIG72_08200 [Pontibacter sp.]